MKLCIVRHHFFLWFLIDKPELLPFEGDWNTLIVLANESGRILSEEGNPDITGKPVGNDKEHNKCTYVSVFGIEGAKKELEKITNEAVEILEYYGDKAEFLKQLAIYIKNRNK